MRRLAPAVSLLLLVGCGAATPIYGPPEQGREVIDRQTPPRLVGGLAEFARRLRYPEEAREAGVQGRLFVTVEIDEQGQVVDAFVTEGLGYGLDEEALRVARSVRFLPALDSHGRPQRTRMTLPVRFNLR